MSPLWRDESGIYLAPRKVCAVHIKRGLRPTRGAQQELSVDPAAAGHWSAALAGLADLLTQLPWQRAAARIVLADCWSRFVVLPWSAQLSSADERLGHARQLLHSAYGDAVRDWHVRLSDAPPGSARVACAIPAELLEGVRESFLRSKARLLSLQPQLVVAYENWRARLPQQGAWFVSAGDEALAAVRIADDAWDRVHSVRLGPNWIRELKRLQTFGRLASFAPHQGEVYVDAPSAWRELAGADAQGFHWLEPSERPVTALGQLHWLRRSRE